MPRPINHVFDPRSGVHTYTLRYVCTVCFENKYATVGVSEEAHDHWRAVTTQEGWTQRYRCEHCTWKARWDAEWERDHPEEEFLYIPSLPPLPDWFLGGRNAIMGTRRER